MYEEYMRMPLLVLYDLENDPYEMQNVYGEPSYRDITASLKKQLKKSESSLEKPTKNTRASKRSSTSTGMIDSDDGK